MEILGALLEQPRLRTNLAQIVNVNLARIDEDYLNNLLRANLIKKDHIESHDVFAITMEGRQFWEELYRLQRKLDPDQTAAPNRLWG